MTGLAKTPFWFLRHGETDWNARNVTQGRTDVPLNARGEAQAEACGAVLAGRGIATIVASTLGRAIRTAEIVGAALGLPFTTDPELREADFGIEEGRPMGTWYERWVTGEYAPEEAETFPALRRRAVAALNRALAKEGPVLVIGHGGFFRAARAEMGLDPRVRTANGVPFWCEPGTSWTLVPLEEVRPAPTPAKV